MRLAGMRMYEAAEQLIVEVELLLPGAKSARPRSADHLERASDSVLFNMGEGIGVFRAKGKIAAYEIARKEANEVRSVLRTLVIARVYTQHDVQKAYDLAGSIVGMLTAAIITLELRAEQL